MKGKIDILRSGIAALSLLPAVYFGISATAVSSPSPIATEIEGSSTAINHKRDGDLAGAPTALRRIPAEVAAVADGKLVVYYMPGIGGGQTVATAMLFIPKGSVPAGGWPLVVFGHDTVGWARECAPSAVMQESGRWPYEPNAAWAADILKLGIVVVAPDYEGMGPAELGVPDTGHPYYNLLSTGRSMVFAAVAAKRALGDKISGAWASAGLSEGGFAALAAAYHSDLAKQQDATLNYRGTLAAAPVPDIPGMNKILWARIHAASVANNLEGSQSDLVFANVETIYMIRGAIHAGYKIDPKKIYGERMLKYYNDNYRMGFEPLEGSVGQDIHAYLVADPWVNRLGNWPGIKEDAFEKNPEVRRFFEENQGKLEHARLPGDILWLQGTQDITAPMPVTYRVVNNMLANGNNIHLAIYEGTSHYGLPIAAMPLMRAHLHSILLEHHHPAP